MILDIDTQKERIICCCCCEQGGVFDTNWDGHHDGGVVRWGGQFPLSENALNGWEFLNNSH